jgi:hypothetical protein
MATKKMTKATGRKIKKYDAGGTATSSRSFNLFGKKYGKSVVKSTDEEGNTSTYKVKTVGKVDPEGNEDFKKIKYKTKTVSPTGDPIQKKSSTTVFMGNGDVRTRSNSYSIPSNSKLMQEKKGGSVKGKKVIKSKKK